MLFYIAAFVVLAGFGLLCGTIGFAAGYREHKLDLLDRLQDVADGED